MMAIMAEITASVLVHRPVSSKGFGLIARIVALTSQNTQVLQGFAYYSLAKSLYYNFIAKRHQTTFPHDTEIQVTLSER